MPGRGKLRTLHYARTSRGAAELWSGEATLEGGIRPDVTVWENAFAEHRLPQDFFRGELDRWWTLTENVSGSKPSSERSSANCCPKSELIC